MPSPPSKADLVELFRKSTPADFAQQILEDPQSARLIESLAAIFAKLAASGNGRQQATYFLPHAAQVAPPAGSSGPATGTVVLRRDGAAAVEIIAGPGELRLEGRGGRFYVNTQELLWPTISSAGLSLTSPFVCEVNGVAGNLDHLGDENGDLPLDRIAVADQSQLRANQGASVVQVSGAETYVQDSGFPSLFTPEDVGLYLQINNAANTANVGRIVKIIGFDFPQEEVPLGSGLFPRRVFVQQTEYSQPREALQFDNSGATFTDETSSAISGVDVPFFPSLPSVDDAFYVLSAYPMSGARFVLTTPADMIADFTWEYWNGTSWTGLEGIVGDAANLQDQVGVLTTVQWTAPTDMAQAASPVSGTPWFQIRVRISSFTSSTTVPVFRNMSAYDWRPLLAETGTVTWSVLDYKDLGVAITSANAFGGGVDDVLRLKGSNRSVYQQDNETDDQFRVRASRLLDVVSPNAILRTVNRQLRPLNYEGRAEDVSSGLTGFFVDEDFFDYYETGDAFPEDKNKVMLSDEEVYGFFAVYVPFLGEGEFGMFYDEGPSPFLEPAGQYIGGAMDHGFFDGEAVEANALYAGLYSSIDAIRAGGVGFTIIRDEEINTASLC